MTDPIGTKSAIPEPVPSAPIDAGPVAPASSAKAPSAPVAAQSSGTRLLVARFSAGPPGVPSSPANKPASWWLEKFASETACQNLPPAWALRAAELNMPDGGLAEKMLDHFLSGSSAPLRIDLNAELERNPQLREYVASRIESEIAECMKDGQSPVDISGAVWVPQSAYGPTSAGKDQKMALGGTYFEFQVVGSSADGGLELKLNVSDHYFWSPSDTARSTHCLHVAGSGLVAAGRATEFYQVGEGRLIVADPSRTQPMDPLEAADDGSR